MGVRYFYGYVGGKIFIFEYQSFCPPTWGWGGSFEQALLFLEYMHNNNLNLRFPYGHDRMATNFLDVPLTGGLGS